MQYTKKEVLNMKQEWNKKPIHTLLKSKPYEEAEFCEDSTLHTVRVPYHYPFLNFLILYNMNDICKLASGISKS